MTIKIKHILCAALFSAVLPLSAQTFTFGTSVNPKGETFLVDSKGFIVNGKHVLPVMGEMHYSRVPEKEWRREIQKMRAGGITVLATYCFWIHHEPVEGQWNWSGNNNLHRFLEICKEEQMPVVLRIGPFCHGEVYQGGFPEWIVKKAQADPKMYKIRSQAPGFMAATQRLYSNIFAQASDMMWKHGGPVVGVQIENECRGPWPYYMALKDMAVSIGFDAPFYTRTGWPKLNGKEEFGKLLPLYGDYADGFWDRVLTDMPGEYAKAFIMKDTRVSGVIATETFGTNQDTKMDKKDLQYPYLTCELGGGMMPAYHRRINMSGNEAMPLAICKLGSGSNLPGYYMYHGGTNPSATVPACSASCKNEAADKAVCQPRTMAETQASPVTNYNDMPYMSYDFQSPLGEMGQPNLNSYHQTRLLHQFLADWGDELSQMDVDTLSEHYARRGCFEFYNDYVRILNEGGVSYVRPVNMPFLGHTITADAQPFCKVGNMIYFIPIKGKKPVITVDGKRYTAKLDKELRVKDVSFCVMSQAKALTAFKIDGELHYAQHAGAILYKDKDQIKEEFWQEDEYVHIAMNKQKDAGAPRNVTMGQQKVAAMPTNEDFDNAAIWAMEITAEQHPSVKTDKLMTLDLQPSALEEPEDYFVQINYEGDCARVYADGKLVMDNFWNGKPMLVRLADLVGKKVELRILPLKKDAPIYLQKEQKTVLDNAENGVLLNLVSVKTLHRTTL